MCLSRYCRGFCSAVDFSKRYVSNFGISGGFVLPEVPFIELQTVTSDTKIEVRIKDIARNAPGVLASCLRRNEAMVDLQNFFHFIQGPTLCKIKLFQRSLVAIPILRHLEKS